MPRRVWTLDLRLIDGDGAEFSFCAGPVNMLTVFGVAEVPISLSGDPAKPGCLVHTVRAVGAVSDALRNVWPGDPVGLRGPFGLRWPMTDGGRARCRDRGRRLGLAPLRPALYQLFAGRARFTAKIVPALRRARARDILFRREIESWRRRLDIEMK